MIWLLPIGPALAGLALAVAAPRRRVATGLAGCAVLLATGLFAVFGAARAWTGTVAWSDTLVLSAAFVPAAAVMAVLVPLIALPVMAYAAAHEDERGLARLAALLLLFVAGMEVLVIAADLLTLLIGWEIVGACSWALIGHTWRDAGSPAAGLYAFIATRLGDRCGMVAFDTEVRSVVPPARRSDQLARVTEAMYALEPALSESDYSGAFTEVVSRFRRRAMLVVVSDLLEQAVTDSLVPALPLITRTHLAVVAGVTDPAVDAWARGPVADDDEVFRRVAAVRALQTRRRAAAQLSALGAIVIDAPPGRLAVDLADAYLQVKTTGRL